MSKPKRQLTIYEKNHLRFFGFNPEDIDRFDQMPVEYITSRAKFARQIFEVNSQVLIPRVETEELVDLAFDYCQQRSEKDNLGLKKTMKIIDIGTGSGCIGISLAKKLAKLGLDFDMTLSDLSLSALAVAKKNWASLCPHIKAQFVESDLFAEISPQKFDLILANLPYIPEKNMSNLPASVKKFEPNLALNGGLAGLALIRRLLAQAKPYLANHAAIFLELDPSQTLKEFSKQYRIELFNDQFGSRRFALLEIRD